MSFIGLVGWATFPNSVEQRLRDRSNLLPGSSRAQREKVSRKSICRRTASYQSLSGNTEATLNRRLGHGSNSDNQELFLNVRLPWSTSLTVAVLPTSTRNGRPASASWYRNGRWSMATETMPPGCIICMPFSKRGSTKGAKQLFTRDQAISSPKNP